MLNQLGNIKNILLGVWAFALAICWILPNHYMPWPSFHMNAWCSFVLLILVPFVGFSGRINKIPLPVYFVLLLALLPWAQYCLGLYGAIGNVWLMSGCLFAFAAAIYLGHQWQARASYVLVDWLFFSILMAAIVSVGLQLHQWLGIDGLDIWSMGIGGTRPYANFGQPNQLATFLIWGILSAIWGFYRKIYSLRALSILVIYFLFGVALTASRTAWIGVLILFFGIFYWKESFHLDRRGLLLLVLFLMCFLSFVYFIPVINENLLAKNIAFEMDQSVRMTAEIRPKIWFHMFLAILKSPLVGYGWGNTIDAQLAVVEQTQDLHVLFSDSHNFVINMFVWTGVPIGLCICACVCSWFVKTFNKVNGVHEIILLMVVLVVANHAMFEYPLSYMYFLLPLGLVVGVLSVERSVSNHQLSIRFFGIGLYCFLGLLFSLFLRDYSRIEDEYLRLRFEWASIDVEKKNYSNQVVLLNQLENMIVFARFEPRENMDNDSLGWMIDVARNNPSPGVVHKLAVALVWNGRVEEGRLWMRKMCSVSPIDQCELVRSAIKRQSTFDKRVLPLVYSD